MNLEDLTQRKRLCRLLILALFLGNIALGFFYFNLAKDFRTLQSKNNAVAFNGKVLDFNRLFIEKVLKAKDEIDFETRLKLESTVRNLNDAEIISAWQAFIDSKTEDEAQEKVKNLLYILSSKIEA